MPEDEPEEEFDGGQLVLFAGPVATAEGAGNGEVEEEESEEELANEMTEARRSAELREGCPNSEAQSVMPELERLQPHGEGRSTSWSGSGAVVEEASSDEEELGEETHEALEGEALWREATDEEVEAHQERAARRLLRSSAAVSRRAARSSGSQGDVSGGEQRPTSTALVTREGAERRRLRRVAAEERRDAAESTESQGMSAGVEELDSDEDITEDPATVERFGQGLGSALARWVMGVTHAAMGSRPVLVVDNGRWKGELLWEDGERSWVGNGLASTIQTGEGELKDGRAWVKEAQKREKDRPASEWLKEYLDVTVAAGAAGEE